MILARANPWAAKQKRAVQLQDRYGAWPCLFSAQMTREQVRRAAEDPRLKEAEGLFREILAGGEGRIPPGAMAVTRHQLALLLHRQGRLAEAAELYREVIAGCRLYAEPSETADWVLCFALFRLAELTRPANAPEAAAMFAEAKEIAERRRYPDAIQMIARAVEYFGLGG
ncbi:MAG: tetratricopeptide repeat protein [Kiritimatiellia bacterium]